MDKRRRNSLLLGATLGLLLAALTGRLGRRAEPPAPAPTPPSHTIARALVPEESAPPATPPPSTTPPRPAAPPAPPSTTALPSPHPPVLPPAATPAAEPEKVVTAAAGFRSVVPYGGALVTGGWRQPDGRRYLAIAVPTAVAGGAVMVSARTVAVPESLLAAPGWARMLNAPEDRLRLGGGIFDAAERADFDRQLAEAEGVDVLSAPQVATALGQLATIEISGPLGGLTVSIIAQPTDDPGAVELALTTAEFTREPAREEKKP